MALTWAVISELVQKGWDAMVRVPRGIFLSKGTIVQKSESVVEVAKRSAYWKRTSANESTTVDAHPEPSKPTCHMWGGKRCKDRGNELAVHRII